MSSWSSLTSPAAYKSPALIALVSVLCVALVLLFHHCVIVTCCRGGGGGGVGGAANDRRRRRQHHHRHVGTASSNARQQDDDVEVSISVEVSAATSRTHLVSSPAAVVCRYRKEERWKEATCAVCLADFDDGEAVRVLPECMHYFHADCIDTWLRGSTSCPMCRADTTPTATPSPAAMMLRHHHHRLELSISPPHVACIAGPTDGVRCVMAALQSSQARATEKPEAPPAKGGRRWLLCFVWVAKQSRAN